MNRTTLTLIALTAFTSVAAQEGDSDTSTESESYSSKDTRQGMVPDLRNDDTEFKAQKGNFVVVPIPVSNPTLGSGLVVDVEQSPGIDEEDVDFDTSSV